MKECVEPTPQSRDIVELYRYTVDLVTKVFDDVDAIFFPPTSRIEKAST